ncbi:MAG: phosphoglucomutase [Desulfobulbaceae bacterium]|nr:phosphoglucomutase [Desulfobulbaceae bacterium]HIJ77831.1 phosphoglucomutase [Deltaproteobacteria bacterium]
MIDSPYTLKIFQKHTTPNSHRQSDYFSVIKELVGKRNELSADDPEYEAIEHGINQAYALVEDEIINNNDPSIKAVSFGTSGWRGIIGKDLFLKSISQVTQAIVNLYSQLDSDNSLAADLGVQSLKQAQGKGAVVGFDNRFGGKLMADRVVDILTGNGFTVHYAGEATTGTLSAAVLILDAAFSINLTPSHNPLEYGGFKFNAADAGPAAATVTNAITQNARAIIEADQAINLSPDPDLVNRIDALACWQELVAKGVYRHGLNYLDIIKRFAAAQDCVVAIDCVHGASRVHMPSFFNKMNSDHFLLLRENADPTFGGVAPEPSSVNMQQVTDILRARPEKLKLGAIIDPDGDRIRFTDGTNEIDMNMFGAMAYHYLHEVKGKKGLVAKTVATSNFANAIAKKLGEDIFEPRVGFKEFKPVIGRALVCFEESDGITVIGHTPEKDAYIGLIMALDMILTLQKNLGDYVTEVQNEFGYYYPGRGGVEVTQQGNELKATLAGLDKYGPGATVAIGAEIKKISEVITIDGRKMILEDGSWLMIRPSGTEPKVRFYLEARSEAGKDGLMQAAKAMLKEIGLL